MMGFDWWSWRERERLETIIQMRGMRRGEGCVGGQLNPQPRPKHTHTPVITDGNNTDGVLTGKRRGVSL